MALAFPKLDKLVKGRFDVVFVPNLHVTPLSAGIPMVLTIHDASWLVNPSWFSPKTRLWHKIVRPKVLVDRATRLIVPSESTAREAQAFLGADPSKIRIIPHGVDPIFSPKPTPQDHGVRSRLNLPKRFALFLGTIEARKNVDGIIEAVRMYREKTGDRLELVLVGSKGWGSLGGSEGLGGRKDEWVTRLGYVPDTDRPALYRFASVFLFSSHMEGFGMPVLEAMASGTPVITSPRGALPEVAGDAAMYADPIDPNRIEMCLEQFFGSQELQAKLSARGLERAKGFDWGETARKTLETLREAAGHE